MEDLLQNGISQINSVLSNHYFSTALLLIMVIYSGMLATKTFNPLKCIFENKFSRIFLMFIILISFEKNKAISIMSAVTIILSLQGIKKSVFLENLSNNVIDNQSSFQKFYTNIQNNISKNIVYDNEVNDILKNEKNIQEENTYKLISKSDEDNLNSLKSEEQILKNNDNEIIKNDIQQTINKTINNDLAPISRVLVEEKIKEQVKTPANNNIIPEGNDINTHSEINYTYEEQTPLDEQISNVKDTEITNNNTKSLRGLNLDKNIDLDFKFDGYNTLKPVEEEINFEKSVKAVVNKKCNLCDQMKSKNNDGDISAYQGEQLAEF